MLKREGNNILLCFKYKNNSNDIKKPSVAKLIIFLATAVLCCVLAIVMIQKKTQMVMSTSTKEEAEQLIDNVLSNDNSMAIFESTYEEDEQESSSNNVKEDYIFADSALRYLDKEDIEYLSKEELRLARNEIYARCGRRFDDVSLQEYFNSKDWYSGMIDSSDFTENMLNDYEIQNVYMISNYESEMGYK